MTANNDKPASAQVREVEPLSMSMFASHAGYEAAAALAAAEPAPCTAADDTPSKSRAKRIRLENGESVAVAQGADTEKVLRDAIYRHFDSRGQVITGKHTILMAVASVMRDTIADHARIVAELRDSVDVAQQEIEELRLHNSKQEALLAAYKDKYGD